MEKEAKKKEELPPLNLKKVYWTIGIPLAILIFVLCVRTEKGFWSLIMVAFLATVFIVFPILLIRGAKEAKVRVPESVAGVKYYYHDYTPPKKKDDKKDKK